MLHVKSRLGEGLTKAWRTLGEGLAQVWAEAWGRVDEGLRSRRLAQVQPTVRRPSVSELNIERSQLAVYIMSGRYVSKKILTIKAEKRI